MKSKLLNLFLLLTLTLTTPAFASESDVYGFSWLDPDKEVFVLQNRKFRKAGRIHANLGAGITTSGAFVDSTSLQGRVGYFMTEEYGLEFIYAANSGKENETAKSVRNQQNNTGSKPFRRIIENYMGAMFLWSPFYSKINTFNKVVYADYIFGLGYGQINEKNNKTEVLSGLQSDEGVETKESHSGFIWQIGMKFHINENFSIRPDITAFHYSAEKVNSDGDTWKSNFDITLSLGYTF